MHPPDSRSFSRVSRRELLKLTPVLAVGAFALPSLQSALLNRGIQFSDWAAAGWFRNGHLAPTFPNSAVVPLSRFPLNSYIADDPGVDLESWTLRVDGAVARPGEYSLERMHGLPRVQQNTRHVCVEGWDVIGSFGGTRISTVLADAGADTRARFLFFTCADDYYESLDMATALHPQSLLCDEMYGAPLAREHGAPLRLILPTKIGYKSAKYLTSVTVTNVLPRRGYWEDQGYPWFAGL
ncbi:MAG: molybdopterin-dependent oxidoreductase [Acidobacteria bacterium]|nr:molybdopterin-dependent oxidoreductase [Acidobacteriota bacterium]